MLLIKKKRERKKQLPSPKRIILCYLKSFLQNVKIGSVELTDIIDENVVLSFFFF